MLNLIAIGDPVIDTHVIIDDSSAEYEESSKNHKHLCFDFGSKIPITQSFQCLGGNAANVAIGAAKLDMQSALCGTVGKDANGEIILSVLKEQKIDTSLISFDPQSQSRYSIVLNFKHERTILAYSDHKQYYWPSKFPETEWIYYSGLGKGFELIQEELVAYLIKHSSVRLVMNPGSYMLKYALSKVLELLPRTDLLIVNLEEAEKLLNTTIEKEKSESVLINKLLSAGAKEVVLTDGERGAWAGNEEEIWHISALPVVVISKTGAGDAFSSGYIAAKHYGHDINHALLWGVANSSASISQKNGSQAGLLDRKGIEKMIGEHNNIKPQLLS